MDTVLQVHSFLITNLAIGDFFMGGYLLIIAVVDSYYRGVYIIYDRSWRNSDLCRFSGFISTFSSELSVFTLTVITLDRLVCIIFPLRVRAFSSLFSPLRVRAFSSLSSSSGYVRFPHFLPA